MQSVDSPAERTLVREALCMLEEDLRHFVGDSRLDPELAALAMLGQPLPDSAIEVFYRILDEREARGEDPDNPVVGIELLPHLRRLLGAR
jgi:hypothetical protein